MNVILKFITTYFNLNVLFLFLISSAFLLFLDCKEYKRDGLKVEYKFSRISAYIYIVVGVGVYVAARFIKV